MNMMKPKPRLSPLRRGILWVSLLAFVLQPMAAMAQVIATPGGLYKPSIEAAANGVPIVQIVTPSAAGVSRNQYEQFNVAAQGLILNNSPVLVQTQQAGWISGNANLIGSPARIILNEVNSKLPSDLRGYMEVAGQKAEVIVANPNGITCNGCGFINTSRGLLTTGTPVFGASGSLDAFRVTGGSIAINGAGLNDTSTEQIDLIARAVQVNAAIWGKNLNVIAGANQVAYPDLATQSINTSEAAPTVAIDVAALGGMYANKIRLIGTEAGVGVASAGTLAAQAGDLRIDSAGRITLANTSTTQASGRIDLTAQQDINNSGTSYAQGAAQLSSATQITNTGLLGAKGDLTLSAANIDSSGTLAAGMAADASIGNDGKLSLNASNTLSNSGQNLAGNAISFKAGTLNLANSQTRSNASIDLSASGDIDHRKGDLSATGALRITAGGTLQNEGAALSANNFDLSVGGLTNRGGTISAQGPSTLTSQGSIDNSQAGFIGSNASLTLSTGTCLLYTSPSPRD